MMACIRIRNSRENISLGQDEDDAASGSQSSTNLSQKSSITKVCLFLDLIYKEISRVLENCLHDGDAFS